MELQKNMIFLTEHQNMKKWEKELLYLKKRQKLCMSYWVKL